MKNLIRLALKVFLLLIILVLIFEYTTEKIKENTFLISIWNTATKAKDGFISGLNAIVDYTQNKDSSLGLAGLPIIKNAEDTIHLDRFWIGVIAGVIITMILGWVLKKDG